jgi:hypothetical protein
MVRFRRGPAVSSRCLPSETPTRSNFRGNPLLGKADLGEGVRCSLESPLHCLAKMVH